MAEAMLFKLPVVTTAYGGQVDCCRDDTSWLIDFSFKKSKTHFNLINSYWVEPDLEHLKRLLREVMELPKFEIERRVERGRSLILDKFRWDNYRERTERFYQI